MITKVLFDTNVVIDLLSRREGFYDSYMAYDIVILRDFEPYLCSNSTTDIVYLLKSCSYRETREEARRTLKDVFKMFDILDIIGHDCIAAYESGLPDYEDALIACSAARNGMSFIITNDRKGFLKSPVPAVAPSEFVKLFKPDDVTYEDAEL